MKNYLLIIISLLSFGLFGQVSLPDTSSYKSIRDKIKDQTFFINLDNSNTNAYKKRADLRNDIKDYKGAIEDYTKVIELNPKDSYEGVLHYAFGCVIKSMMFKKA